MALSKTIVLLTLLLTACFTQRSSPGIHLPLHRRGGRFSHHEPANLTYISQILDEVEAKYARSYRTVEGNCLIRRWRESQTKDENDPEMIDVAGREGRW
jgi:hypothetical protein